MNTNTTDRGIRYSKHLVEATASVHTNQAIVVAEDGPKGTGKYGKWVISKVALHTLGKEKDNFPYVIDLTKLPPEIQLSLVGYTITAKSYDLVMTSGKSTGNALKDFFKTSKVFAMSCLGFAPELYSANDHGFYVYHLHLPTTKDLEFWTLRDGETGMIGRLLLDIAA